MIPRAHVVSWSRQVPWPNDDQVEQDLLLSRLIAEIADAPYLGEELVFRGGTCLHKLHTPTPARYSEDLDYVRRSATGIRELTRALTTIGQRLGMEVRTRIGQQPKVYLRAPYESGSGTMRLKIEVNTLERSPIRELVRLPFTVQSPWFTQTADVRTHSLPELMATKICALFQRSKGRDLFDLWLALAILHVAPEQIVDCFARYRPNSYTARRAEENLRSKLNTPDFRNDLDPLVASWPDGYDMDEAADVVMREIIGRL